MELSEEKISELKKKHGAIFLVEVEGHKAILKKPNRKVLQMANRHQQDSIRMAEIILENCWIEGDHEIKDDDDLFLAAAQVLGEMIEFKQAELKKL